MANPYYNTVNTSNSGLGYIYKLPELDTANQSVVGPTVEAAKALPESNNWNSIGLTSGMSNSDFSTWYSNPDNAAKFNALPPSQQGAYAKSMTGDATGTGWSDMGFMDKAQIGIGVGQLGLGVLGYLENAKTAKLQRENLKTQIASNKDLLATRKKRAADISKAFGA